MVLLISMLVFVGWAWAAELTPSWGRDQVPVVLLPVSAHPLAGRVPAAVRASLAPGLVWVELEEQRARRLATEPSCRVRPQCLRDSLPSGVRYAVDVQLTGGSATPLVELRLLRAGSVVERRSVYLRSAGFSAKLTEELVEMLRPHHLDARHYTHAVKGEQRAIEALRTRFPDSPWTAALPPPQSSASGDDAEEAP
jgi:hypothetical protein